MEVNMKHIFRYITILALVFVTGCASQFKSDVARFHRLSQPAGETFQIEPMDEARRGSLEFEQYATLVGDRLVSYGYRATPENAAPDMIVRLDYGVDDGQVRVKSSPSFGYYGYPYGPWRYGYYDPFYPYGWGAGYDRDIRSEVYYNRKLKMDIVKPVAGQSPTVLFEGRVESEGRDNRLPEVMPYLVEAMFANFPGQSGVTQHVVIERESSGAY